jgi:hypothetical protein
LATLPFCYTNYQVLHAINQTTPRIVTCVASHKITNMNDACLCLCHANAMQLGTKHLKCYRRDLNVGDLVLRRSQNTKGRHKLTPPWEGPYIIAEVLKPGTYKLSNEKVKSSPTLRTLNSYVAFSLKRPRGSVNSFQSHQ